MAMPKRVQKRRMYMRVSIKKIIIISTYIQNTLICSTKSMIFM